MENQTTKAKSKINRRNYSRISGSLELPNLVEIQTNSYKWFKEVGIKEVFDDIYPITNFNETLSKIASFDFNKTSGTSAMTSFKRYTTNIDNKTKNILCLKLELTLNKLESNIEKVST